MTTTIKERLTMSLPAAAERGNAVLNDLSNSNHHRRLPTTDDLNLSSNHQHRLRMDDIDESDNMGCSSCHSLAPQPRTSDLDLSYDSAPMTLLHRQAGHLDLSDSSSDNEDDAATPIDTSDEVNSGVHQAIKKSLYLTFVTTPVLTTAGLRMSGFNLFAGKGFKNFDKWYKTCPNRKQTMYKDSGDKNHEMDIYLPLDMVNEEQARKERRKTTANLWSETVDSNDNAGDLFGLTDEDESSTFNDDNVVSDEEPEEETVTPQRPVVIVIPGGGWIMGDKKWGGLLARTLTEAGLLVFVPQYRNYPATTMPGMVDDVTDAIQWTIDNCTQYGGDPKQVIVVGQSAGGHLAMCSMLRQLGRHMDAVEEEERTGKFPCGLGFQPNDHIKGMITVGSPFDIGSLRKDFAKKGVPFSSVKKFLFAGQMSSYDPNKLVRRRPELATQLPPVHMLHGTRDKTVPFDLSKDFCALLTLNGAKDAQFTAYQGFSHTDAMMEQVLMGNNQYHQDVYTCIQRWARSHDNSLLLPDRVKEAPKMAPKWRMNAGRWMKPW